MTQITQIGSISTKTLPDGAFARELDRMPSDERDLRFEQHQKSWKLYLMNCSQLAFSLFHAIPYIVSNFRWARAAYYTIYLPLLYLHKDKNERRIFKFVTSTSILYAR